MTLLDPQRGWLFSLQNALFVGLVASLAPVCFAQTKNADINPAGGNLPIQKIGPNDLVSIQVYDSPELTRTVRVSEDGTLRLPLLREPIRAQGLYPPELEQAITNALKDEGILVRPIVSVSISEYRSRPIRVVGAVRHPTTFQATGNVRLLDAITNADGLSDAAGSEILVTSPSPDGGQELTRRIPVKELIEHGDETVNIPLLGGEEVRVPEGGRVYVMGNVVKPGPIPVHDPSEMTVLRVIAQAGGLLPFSGKEAYILRHTDSPKNEVPIPLAKIMERKDPDVPLIANDVLFVPDSKGKKNTARMIELMTGFGVGTLSGILVFKH